MWQVVLAVTPTTVTLFLLGALALALGLALWSARAPHRRTPQTAARALLAAWLLLVLVVTLAPTQPIGSGDATFWWRPGGGRLELGAPLEPGEVAMAVRRQIAGVALFVPVPVLLRFAAPRWSAAGAFLFGVGLSVAVETGQLLMRAGRVADIDDVLCAAAGTVVGAALALLAKLAAALLYRRALPAGAVRTAPAPAPEEA
ncbi:VanZ family protein [Streptomyces sp. NPDC057555]|uniref:VanZ family protein n=1 Tax=unclassified Streptomyces TaxID=2593676 RepID=UPI00344DB60F